MTAAEKHEAIRLVEESAELRNGLFRLLRDVSWRKRCSLAKEEVLHLFGDQVLCLLLPGHQAILVEDHLHPLFPQLPGLRGHLFKDALAQLAGPRGSVEPGDSPPIHRRCVRVIHLPLNMCLRCDKMRHRAEEERGTIRQTLEGVDGRHEIVAP